MVPHDSKSDLSLIKTNIWRQNSPLKHVTEHKDLFLTAILGDLDSLLDETYPQIMSFNVFRLERSHSVSAGLVRGQWAPVGLGITEQA